MTASGAPTTGDVLHSARAYDALVWVLTLGRERRFRDRMVELARLETGESVLDVGCGTGALAIAAKARVGLRGQVSGVDPSPEMVARARRKAARSGREVKFETAAVEALPFPDDTFDAVLSSLMLHHLSDDGRQPAASEIARVLRPGGRFLAVDISGGHRQRFRLHLRAPKHAHFDLDELTPLFDRAGFEVIEKGPIGGPRMIGVSSLRFVLMAAASVDA